MKAYYDPRLDAIVGAERGSYAWEHEQRHREQYHSGIAQKVDVLQVWGYYCGMSPLLLSVFFIPWLGFSKALLLACLATIGLAYLPFTLGMVYLEADAYLVGWIRWRRHRI